MIDTKYDIGQKVWFMYQNECVNMEIEDIRIQTNPLYIQYVFNNRSIWLSVKYIFSTKEELLKSL